MQEKPNEKISLLVDHELDKGQALALLRQVQGDPALQAKLRRYQMFSQALKHESCCPAENRLRESLREKLLQEPSYLLPARKPQSRTGNGWRTAGLALAASFLLAMVWVAGKLEKSPLANAQMQFALGFPAAQPLKTAPVNDRFSDLLQAHDNSVYVNHVGNVQPYARVVGFQQE